MACLTLPACGGSSADPTDVPVSPVPTETTETPEDPDVPTPDPDNTPQPAPENPELFPEPVLLARDAAAEEAGVPPEDVRVLSYQERDWPSTALGCPQPGFSYAQVVTPGFQVLIEANDTTYEYHTNMATNVILCTTLSN